MLVKFVSTVYALVVIITSIGGTSLPWVPCPHIFQYMKIEGQYVGIITIRGISYGETTIEIDYFMPGFWDADDGELTLFIKKNSINEYIESGTPITFKAQFPVPSIVPGVANIRHNGATICYNPTAEHFTRFTYKYVMFNPPGGYGRLPTSPMQMFETFGNQPDFSFHAAMHAAANRQMSEEIRRHSLPFMDPFNSNFPAHPYSSNPSGNPALLSHFNSIPWGFRYGPYGPSASPAMIANTPYFDSSSTIPNMSTEILDGPSNPLHIEAASPPPTFQYINTICGRENIKDTVFAASRNSLASPQFPWIVAIFKLNKSSLSFQCGGSLISSRTVLSAAHCFKDQSRTIPTEHLLFSLGRFRISDWLNATHVGAQDVILHPDYGLRNKYIDADIAIVRLKDPIRFSATIRPICLWEHSIADDHAMAGSIVGWGKDGSKSAPVDAPKIVGTTLVSQRKCVRSTPDLFYLTSNRTMCANYKSGTGPCEGDSGSGLMTRRGNIWLLRGIVSRLLESSSAKNPEDYAIFSDVAKFTDWIKENMLV